ncbi:nickel ABC transporter permease [Petroclostridium sp. X23]|uniref:nickel ABC transporter permease n=1 Tax=Petroclostridium sp. X23 TaxID=3045146 RepID=UPI0024AE349D|nr:nickel ABC transporter permease [Petroclostridium sp. X23]WHH58671.1 ABC transporter permease [Petroclostridium sp. X23]
MKNYIGKRFIQLIIVILGATFLTFALTYISPGDPAELMLKSHDIVPTEQMLEKTREEMGLNKPFLMQYGIWLKNILTGDLGYSYISRSPVAGVLAQKIPMTVKLAAAALLFLAVFSLVLGILSAINKSKPLDYIIRILSFAEISIPTFWLGLILIYSFVVKIHWFTITNPNSFKSIILPAVTLAIPLIGRYTRQIRAAILDQLSYDYVVGARARGIRESAVIFKHVLPNALMSIITLFGLSTALLLGGTVIVENIFSWPGLGSMALEAITYRDYPLLQAYVIFMAVIYVSINFIVDIITQALDPRVDIRGDKNR